ncbi:fumarylacetoacetate hydrolase family protein [Hymenobacter aerilatus]|uniref:fumarylacetoacetase n=1 Tax=Hymenobacter aerilatus TaxID=2932251 RepID=A0A8T9SZS1_9BACT|nr:fumarylacetoacetate hydrolase family protein [Hymenobacter aerilatus]UOR07117.1 fumarylacetoacetate hydrolase family protein [Hymenobacter aerilatus]
MASANDPTLHSWIDIPPTSDFPIQNLPFGIFETEERGARVGVAIGGYVLDLYAVSQWGFFDDLDLKGQPKVFRRRSLNAFIRLGRPAWRAVRERVSELLRHDNTVLQSPEVMRDCLLRQTEVQLLPPVKPCHFVRFTSRLASAPTLPANEPDPTPAGSYGPAGSLLAASTRIRRPARTYLLDVDDTLRGPVQRLDFEVQLGFVGGQDTALGTALPVEEAEETLFGLTLVLGWYAHDLCRGSAPAPLLDRSFGSSLSAWVVTLDALEPFRVAGTPQLPEPEPHLRQNGQHHVAVQLEVALQPANGPETVIATPTTRSLYWSVDQQLAYLTSSGTPLHAGDLYTSGTVADGSLYQLTASGTQPLVLNDSTMRLYLETDDQVRLSGYCEQEGVRLGFGEVTGVIE